MRSELQRWTSGTGKVLEVGDTVRIDNGRARYSITRILVTNDDTHIEVYGGRPGFLSMRTFRPEQLTRCTTDKTKLDPNAGYRETIREVSNAAKKHRRLR